MQFYCCDSFMKEYMTREGEDWYNVYGRVLVEQLQDLEEIISTYKANQKQWLVQLLQVIIVISRFFEGVSWGYSS